MPLKVMVIIMSLIIDAMIILASVVSIYLGLSRGFVKSVMGFASLLAAAIAAMLFTPTLSALLCENFVADKVAEIATGALAELVDAGEQQLELSGILNDRPDALGGLVDRFGGDIDELVGYYGTLEPEDDTAAIAKLAAKLTAPTAKAISNVFAAIIIFAGALILLRIALGIVDLVCRLPVLSTLNTLLGLLFGIGSAAVASLVIANLAVGMIDALNAIDPAIFNSSVINDSLLLRFISENNFIFTK